MLPIKILSHNKLQMVKIQFKACIYECMSTHVYVQKRVCANMRIDNTRCYVLWRLV